MLSAYNLAVIEANLAKLDRELLKNSQDLLKADRNTVDNHPIVNARDYETLALMMHDQIQLNIELIRELKESTRKKRK